MTTIEGMARSYGRATADELPADLGPDDLYPAPFGGRFKTPIGDKLAYIEAPDLAELAEGLIEEWPEFGHIETLRVRYLWKDKGTSTAMGKCTKVGGFWPALVGIDIVIWLGAEDVRQNYFTRRQVEALLYHEMSHIGVDEDDGKALIIQHEAELFFMELKRYGIWRSDFRRFGQLALDGMLAQGPGLVPMYGACPNGCGTIVRRDSPCPTCASSPPLPMEAVVACTSCGTVQDPETVFVRGICLDCYNEGTPAPEVTK